jgi:cupredoxin-like protein
LTRAAIVVLVAVLVLGGLFFLLRPGNPSGAPQDRTFDISIKNGEMKPAEISVREGDSVTLRIDSDESMEFHLHGYDAEREVQPGETAELHFRADITGRFEIEDHESEKELGVLRVYPGREVTMRRVLTAASAFCLILVDTSPAPAHGFVPTFVWVT